jgi:hypothetical protein
MRLSFTQEADFRQLRDFGQKFSATFDFIGTHWRGLGRALVTIVLPAALVQGVVNGLMQQQLLALGTGRISSRADVLERLAVFNSMRQLPFYWVNMATAAVFITLLVLTVYGYVRCCLHARDSHEPIGPGQVWAVVKEEFLGAFFSYFGLLLAIIIGFFLFFIPGLYLSIALSLFYAVKVMEGTGFGATFSRCLQLVKGKWWSTCGLLFVMSFMLIIVVAVVSGIFGGLLYAIMRGVLGSVLGEGDSPMALFTVVVTTLTSLFNLLIYPPLLLALGFQYFNLVERRDGVGLRHLVDQLGRAPASVQNAAYRPDDEGEY